MVKGNIITVQSIDRAQLDKGQVYLQLGVVDVHLEFVQYALLVLQSWSLLTKSHLLLRPVDS